MVWSMALQDMCLALLLHFCFSKDASPMLYRRQVEFGSTNTSRHLEHFRTSWIIWWTWPWHTLARDALVADGRVGTPRAKPKCSFIAADLQLWARKIEGKHLVNVISFAQPNRSWIHFVNPYSIFSWCAKDRYPIVKWFRVAHAADFPCFSSRTVGQFWSASFSDLLRGVVNSFWYGSCASVLISYLWGKFPGNLNDNKLIQSWSHHVPHFNILQIFKSSNSYFFRTLVQCVAWQYGFLSLETECRCMTGWSRFRWTYRNMSLSSRGSEQGCRDVVNQELFLK